MAANPLLTANGATNLSPQQLLAAAKALATSQTAGPLADLAKQIAANQTQGAAASKLTAGYFNQFNQQAKQGLAAQQQNAAALNTTLGNVANDEQGALAGFGQNAQTQMAKYAPQGQPGGLQTTAPALQSLSAEMARQQGLAAQREGVAGTLGAQLGSNATNLAAQQFGIQGQQGKQDLTQLAQGISLENAPLNQKIADDKAAYGSNVASNLVKLRQQQFANQVTAKGLGIQQQSANTAAAKEKLTAANDEASLKFKLDQAQQAQMNSDRNYQLNKSKFGAAQAKDTYLRTHGLGPYKVATPKTAGQPKVTPTGTPTLTALEQQRMFGQINTATGLISQMRQPLSAVAAKTLTSAGYNFKQGQKLNDQQIRYFLTHGPNPGSLRLDPAQVDAAYALKGWGGLSQKQVTALNKIGLIVGSRYKRVSGLSAALTDTTGGVPPAIRNPLGAAI